MIDIFQPLKFEISQAPSDEILIILSSSIDKYVVDESTCGDFIEFAEGFFRLQSRRPATTHNSYVCTKTREIYEIVKNLASDSGLIRIDYSLSSDLMVSIYILADSKTMVGGIKGYRSDRMTQEEYRKLWYGPNRVG